MIALGEFACASAGAATGLWRVDEDFPSWLGIVSRMSNVRQTSARRMWCLDFDGGGSNCSCSSYSEFSQSLSGDLDRLYDELTVLKTGPAGCADYGARLGFGPLLISLDDVFSLYLGRALLRKGLPGDRSELVLLRSRWSHSVSDRSRFPFFQQVMASKCQIRDVLVVDVRTVERPIGDEMGRRTKAAAVALIAWLYDGSRRGIGLSWSAGIERSDPTGTEPAMI